MQTRIYGLDSVRFIAAIWVMLYHLGFTNTFNIAIRDNYFKKVFGALIDVIFCGPAAVIIFFVVSGFCINYNYGKLGKPFPVVNFIIRRYVRILLPVIGCVYCLSFVGAPDYSYIQSAVGWSVECELVYYTFFPLILILSRKYGWSRMLLVSLICSFLSLFFSGTEPCIIHVII